MSNPVLVEVTRGDMVESRHRGAFALCDAAGRIVAEVGDVEVPIFPRSAVKALQALPLVESGAADRLGLTSADLALACASHGGEPVHVETARAMLAKAGRSPDALECGVHWPTSKSAARALVAAHRTPTALHNNCSGKHAGFLCLAYAIDADPRGYVAPNHPVQRRVRDAMAEICGCTLERRGIDGCSIPTYATPLRNLALGFARLATGAAIPADRAAAAARLRQAVADHPVLVAGAGRLDTRLAAHFGTRLFTKTGAEGVFCAAMPELGLGLALKCDDGALRGSEAVLLAILARIMDWSTQDRDAFDDTLEPTLRNWNGIAVGRVQVAGMPTELPGRV